MRIGLLGTGVVGKTIATKLVQLGHDVTMGSRQAGNENAVAWASANGDHAHAGTMADAAEFGRVVINATRGSGALEALEAAGSPNLEGKVVIDISNSLDHTGGFPPMLLVANTDSLGEQIQRAFPAARVVKTLNTVTADVMVNPGIVAGGHTIFVSGNDAEAKQIAVTLLRSFGWSDDDIMDLGDITTARGPEMYVALWLRVLAKLGTPHFSIRVVTGG
jgi:8-hydroxy-5-deazaflavin:NADPH oxidoreductase